MLVAFNCEPPTHSFMRLSLLFTLTEHLNWQVPGVGDPITVY